VALYIPYISYHDLGVGTGIHSFESWPTNFLRIPVNVVDRMHEVRSTMARSHRCYRAGMAAYCGVRTSDRLTGHVVSCWEQSVWSHLLKTADSAQVQAWKQRLAMRSLMKESSRWLPTAVFSGFGVGLFLGFGATSRHLTTTDHYRVIEMASNDSDRQFFYSVTRQPFLAAVSTCISSIGPTRAKPRAPRPWVPGEAGASTCGQERYDQCLLCVSTACYSIILRLLLCVY
jgi:hypothetical protein